jgi:hypothetical protein
MKLLKILKTLLFEDDCNCQDDKGDRALPIVRKTILNLNEEANISEGLKYHIEHGKSIIENEYRPQSTKHFALLQEVRSLYDSGQITLSEDDEQYFKDTDLGRYGVYEGVKVPLDHPLDYDLLTEAEYRGKKVQIGKPRRSSGPKKYVVYVKTPKGNVKKVNFGDAKGGLTAKINDPKARKAFSDRHNCPEKKDKTKAGYWACRLPRHAALLGLKSTFKGYW